MLSLVARVPARLSHLSFHGFSFAPLAGLGARDGSPDPVFFLSGMAVLSAGLVVMRAAHGAVPAAARPPVAVSAGRVAVAERAVAEPAWRPGDREVLLDALATAAETFYAIAGHLPRDASDRALGKADDLRELVWLNRS
jgi:hypothetical protein